MSVKKLFDNNKQIVTVGKFLKLSAPDALGDGIESDAHLSASIQKQDYFLPPVDYSKPENFVKFGSAEQYYSNAFNYIANYYPYDGSILERVSFYNKINPLEKYILEDLYPTSTGYVTIGADYGTVTTNATGYDSSSAEYIQIKGGPHSGSIYKESKNRTSNLEFGGSSGSSVEFFLKKNSASDGISSSEKQVIFDLWNGASDTSATATAIIITDGTPIAPDDGKTIIITNYDGTTATFTLTAGTRSSTEIDRSAIGNANDFATEIKASMDLAVAAGLIKGTVSAVENDANGNPRMITITAGLAGTIGNKAVSGTFITGGGGELVCNPAGNDPASGNGTLAFTGGVDGGYGRMRIELRSPTEDRFYVTMLSGATGFSSIPVPTTGNIDITDGVFRNFAFVFNTSGSIPTLDFFVNGACIQTGITSSAISAIGLVTGSMIGNIGALRTDIEGSPGAAEGYGKLSASIDEFRFWKTSRNDEQIGRYWFDNVGGGTDKYDANVGLGVYLKFNEGITQTASVDKICLDYSGRLSNGTFTGYSNTYSRNTASAIDSLSLESVKEVGDPIIRTSNPLYITTKADYVLTGSNYDYNNNSRLLNHLPNWIIEEEENGENEIVSVTQILSSYFDTLYNQLTALKELRHLKYISGSATGSINEYPYNDRLVESMGLEMPEFFQNAGTLQQFLKRDEQINFEQRLVGVKNSIYKNIYNNLSFILKSKGTEKSIRNFIRCLGVSEEVIALNTYPDNSDYEIKSNYYSTTSTKRFADFTGFLNQDDVKATVYQYPDSSNINSKGFVTGSVNLEEFAFSLQSEIVFPNKDNPELLPYVMPRVVTSSLMGFHTPFDSDQTSTDMTWQTAGNDYGLQVYAIRSPGEYPKVYSPNYRVRDAYFVVKDRAGTTLLTSSIFNDVYDNQKWNFTLSLRPKKYPFADGINGASVSTDGYTLELYGVNYDTGIKRNSFLASADMTYNAAAPIVESNKRVYVGAHRTNYTGSLLTRSDVRASSVRYWTDHFPTGTLDLQAKETDTHGRLRPYRNAYSFQSQNPNVYIPRIQTLALNWDFADITGSDTSGQFTVQDISSGSVAADYPSQYQKAMFSNINLRQHSGRGDFFAASATPVRKEYVYTEKLQVPEYVGGEEMVQALNSDEQTFGIYTRPETFYFAVERSMYRSISNRMLELFASIEDFNNLIGEPVNKYRLNYKRMEKVREIFFRKVRNDIPDLEKYIDYYKWLDTSMSQVIEEFFPESARHASDVRKIVENHVLERPKIQHKISILRDRHPGGTPGPSGSIRGSVCLDYPGWGKNHRPISGLQTQNCFWWQTRAERDEPPLVVTAGNLPSRNAVLNAAQKDANSHSLICLSANIIPPYYGGINQYLNKKRRFRDLTFDRFEPLEDCTDEDVPNEKKKIAFRATKDGTLYKGSQITPFTAVSSSILSGYNAELNSSGLTGISLTNLHEDSILPYRHSVPMQGPFPQRWVGGIQARHNAPFRTVDRAEEYSLEITTGTGSITTLTIENQPKGQYLRGLASKSPVNISNIKTVISEHTTPDGVRVVGNYSKYYEVVQGNDRSETNMDFVFNNDHYAYSMPSAFLTPPARRTLGLTGSADYPAPRQRQAVAATAILITDGTPIGADDGKTIVVTNDDLTVATFTLTAATRSSTQIDRSAIGNANDFATEIKASMDLAVAAGLLKCTVSDVENDANGNPRMITLTSAITGQKGNQPVAGTFITGGGGELICNPAGNDPAAGNGTLAFTGGDDAVRTNQTIFTDRFAAPGSKQDSKQQFRDVNSDQFSPNNALPFRNMAVRQPYHKDLTEHSLFGGVVGVATGSAVLITDSAPIAADDGKTIVLTNFDDTTVTLTMTAATTSATQISRAASGNADLFAIAIKASLDLAFADGTLKSRVSAVENDANGNPRMITLTSKVAGTRGNKSVYGTLITGGGGEVICNPAGNDPGLGNGTLTFLGGTDKPSVHKTPMNRVNQLLIDTTFPTTTVITGSTFDNGYVTRALPAADRSQWTSYISGSDNASVYGQYVALRSRYPANISFVTQSLNSVSSWDSALVFDLAYTKKFKWSKNRDFVPWKQISNGTSPYAKFYTQKNTYNILPQEIETVQDGTGLSMISYADGSRGTLPTTARQVTDWKGNTSNYYYSVSLREAPITSRYKPLIHQIKTPLGTPAKTLGEKITVSMKYSYGNELMGFANRELNRQLDGGLKFSYGKIKRPYEILRDQFVPPTPRVVNGADLIKVFSYPETIYPKEIYTYFSGSRARLSFINDFWRSDIAVASYNVGAFTSYVNLRSEENKLAYNRQLSRVQGNFVTSQGYAVQASEQTPYNSLDASHPIGTGNGSGSMWPLDSYLYSDSTGSLVTILTASAPVVFADAATMPCGELMMTHYGTINDKVTNVSFRDGTASYVAANINSAQYVYNIPVTTFTAYATPAVPANASITAVETVPSILDGKTIIITTTTTAVTFTFDQTKLPSSALLRVNATSYFIGCSGVSTTNDVINAIYTSVSLCKSNAEIDVTPVNPGAVGAVMQIVADVPGVAMNGQAITGTGISGGQCTQIAFSGGAAGGVAFSGELPEPRAPGAAYTRPAWTAGRDRRYVDGPRRGQIAQSVYPFYGSYEEYVSDIRLVGKDHTILPEFRISEHVEQYKNEGALFAVISASLEITGSNTSNFDGTNPSFYERFAQTDDIEFLEDFMPTDEGDRNFIFNNYPRHFELESEAIVKLLPYSGFYPVDRTLDIASLFRTTYSPNAVFTGTSGGTTPAWRSILRPFFAPGIMYNSIKSGLAVDYPIRRSGRNADQYFPLGAATFDSLRGCLSGALDSSTTEAGTIPGNSRRNKTDLEWATSTEVDKFFWADRLPFETILDPAAALEDGFEKPTVLSDINQLLYLDVSGSITTKGLDDTLYKKAVSNFLANVPKFFLSKKENKFGSDGYLTKFVAQFGKPASAEGEVSTPVRTVGVQKDVAYMMEIGLMKTDEFNFYSNPYAFGVPTATGSAGWDTLTANQVPKPLSWPRHRGEFAPFTPPHYYGPSLVRITFMPEGDREEYTLDEIINNDRGEVFVQFLNASGSFYDFTSGSFVDRDGAATSTTATPDYGWNRAWQNRMDLDASISINNEFPTDHGGLYKSTDPNKWVIMPKWECPTLDFPDRSGPADQYALSSSVSTGLYTSSAQGMWHQYGVMPQTNQGSYLYIKDIPTGELEEYDLVAIASTVGVNTERTYKYVKKVPDFVLETNRSVQSLADLCGFDPEEIIRSGFDMSKAKRLGELAVDDEKSISEAILALPFYIDPKLNKPRLITLQAPADKLGPKIKQFRKQFTKFSLPPVLARKLLGMIPQGYPTIPDFINPFGGDDYDSILDGEEMAETPVVYLMEHKVSLTRQDLSDIWQGIMPELSTNFKQSVSAIDHYMPGDNVEEDPTRFPEVMREQLNLDMPRDGHPRYDLLDIAKHPDRLGFFPDIKWLVFKVKERGIPSYTQMVVEEVEGDKAFTYDSVRQMFINEGMDQRTASRLLADRDNFSKSIYILKHHLSDPTYNWPYDYCSVLELGKINTKIGFRPELKTEMEEYENEGRFRTRELERAVEETRTGSGVIPSPGLDLRQGLSQNRPE